MRFLVVALAVLSAVWAQDPEGLGTMTGTSTISQVTPRTWASAATTKRPTMPSYTPQSVSWTTITSEGTLYQVAVPPRTITWTTITSGGGIWKVPVSATSSAPAVATAAGVPAPAEPTQAHSSHKTRTIVLSVVLSFLGAVLLLLAAMFFMRIRNRRRMRDRRSWAMRPGGWVTEQKDAYPLDVTPVRSMTVLPSPSLKSALPLPLTPVNARCENAEAVSLNH
ncbi:hypothetical protein FRC09_020117 [Ceratobasidium sp. 395]|nr:hypothetical protein FRC09_020117 [Ceratobasidium sp. 395]